MYKLIVDDHHVSTITLSHDSYYANESMLKEIKTLNYGIRSTTVEVTFSETINSKEMLISKDSIDNLMLPIYSQYDIRINNENMIIGPYIGILCEISNERLNRIVPSLTSYLKEYDKIGGTIIAFALEGVKKEEMMVQGFIYNPTTNSWTPGTFPYPRSLFSICELSMTSKWEQFKETMKHFNEVLSHSVFNYPYFDKLKMYEYLKDDFAEYLPDTFVYRSPDDIHHMLKKHKRIYVKPIEGRLGKSVFRFTYTTRGVIVHYGRKEQQRRMVFTRKQSFINFAQYHLSPNKYIIQQAIYLVSYENRLIDFRLILTKNEHGIWENLGFIGRYGATNSIVSNVTAGGMAEMGEATLAKVLSISKHKNDLLYEEMSSIGEKIVTTLEKKGYHLGNIGLDIGIDVYGRIWVIEVNHQNPDHYIALRARNKKLFLKARAQNMFYAKRLAGV